MADLGVWVSGVVDADVEKRKGESALELNGSSQDAGKNSERELTGITKCLLCTDLYALRASKTDLRRGVLFLTLCWAA